MYHLGCQSALGTPVSCSRSLHIIPLQCQLPWSPGIVPGSSLCLGHPHLCALAETLVFFREQVQGLLNPLKLNKWCLLSFFQARAGYPELAHASGSCNHRCTLLSPLVGSDLLMTSLCLFSLSHDCLEQLLA